MILGSELFDGSQATMAPHGLQNVKPKVELKGNSLVEVIKLVETIHFFSSW